MSGVRARNPALLEIGLTLPGFIERSRVIASLPSLSLLTLASHTPDHWQLEYREMDEMEDGEPARIADAGYDIVAISCLSARVLEAYTLADALRAKGVTVVIGGLHVSALPQEAMRHADSVVQGEGESLWPRLLDDFERGELQTFYSSFGERPAYSLAQARVPRYDLLDIRQYNRLTLQTTRGCPLDCAFCAASRTISAYKLKPIAQVRRELEAILAVWPHPFIELADDNTFVNKKWSRELAALLGEYDVPWFTETDISVADDDELLRLLAQSNCAQILIGFESVSAAALGGIDGRRWKQGRAARYAEQIQKIQSHGIAVNGCFVVGFDEDDPGVFERTRDWVLSSELAEVQITLLTPFPGTALHRSLEAQERLLKPVYWEQCTLFDATFRPRQMSVAQLEEGFRGMMADIYSPTETARRKRISRSLTRTRRNQRQLICADTP